MRHKHNKLLQLNTGVQKKQLVIRTLMTNFFKNGKIVTTPKRAKVLKAEVDSFLSKLVRTYKKYDDEKVSKRECIRIVKNIIFTEEVGKKIIDDLLSKYLEKEYCSSFVSNYKLGYRKGDGVEQIMLKLS